MLHRMKILGGLVLLIAAASTVQAQDRPRGQGFGFGFGGPGGFGGAGFDAFLLASPEVQKELGVSDEQKGLIGDMMTDIQNQMRGARGQGGAGGFQNFQNLSEEERNKLIEEGRKRMEEMNKKTEEMINMVLEPKQTERFGQLRLQRAGVGAFNRPDVAEKIGITQEQKEKIQKIQESLRPDPNAFANFQNMSEEERRDAFTKMQEKGKKANEDILNVLTAEQKETWAKMQGKKFEFPPPQGFGTRRPGGGQ